MHPILLAQLQTLGLDKKNPSLNGVQWEKLLALISGQYAKPSRGDASTVFPAQQIKSHNDKSASRNHTLAAKYSAKILIVEDNEVNKQVAKHMLEVFGCQVSDVSDGAQALQILEISNFDLVFMDCQMPVMDGVEATKHIREKENDSNEHLTIIALTANASDDMKDTYIKIGMDDYLCKPFIIEEMHSKLEKWLKHKKILIDQGKSGEFHLFDEELFKKLMYVKGVGNTSIGKSIFSSYLQESKNLLYIISEKTHMSIDAHCIRALNKLSAASESIGAMNFSEECRKFQETVTSKHPGSIDKQLRELKQAHTALTKKIQNFLHQYGMKIDHAK